MTHARRPVAASGANSGTATAAAPDDGAHRMSQEEFLRHVQSKGMDMDIDGVAGSSASEDKAETPPTLPERGAVQCAETNVCVCVCVSF